MKRTGFLLAILLLPGGRAHACSALSADLAMNKQVMEQYEAALAKYRDAVVAAEGRCQALETDFARVSGRQATGEACPALRENAEMNRHLSETSQQCSDELEQLAQRGDSLVDNFIAPFAAFSEGIVQEGARLEPLVPECASIFAQNQLLLKKANGVQANAQAAVSDARGAMATHGKILVATRRFFEKSASSFQSCGIALNVPLLKAPLSHASGKAPARAPASVRPAGNQESTITGSIPDHPER